MDASSRSIPHDESVSASTEQYDVGDVYRILSSINFSQTLPEHREGVSAHSLPNSDIYYDVYDEDSEHAESNISRLCYPEYGEDDYAQKPKHRPRRSAAARRQQRERSQARAMCKILKGLMSLESHRGCQLSQIGHILRDELCRGPNMRLPQGSAAQVQANGSRLCRHFAVGRCTYGSRCRFSHTDNGNNYYDTRHGNCGSEEHHDSDYEQSYNNDLEQAEDGYGHDDYVNTYVASENGYEGYDKYDNASELSQGLRYHDDPTCEVDRAMVDIHDFLLRFEPDVQQDAIQQLPDTLRNDYIRWCGQDEDVTRNATVSSDTLPLASPRDGGHDIGADADRQQVCPTLVDDNSHENDDIEDHDNLSVDHGHDNHGNGHESDDIEDHDNGHDNHRNAIDHEWCALLQSVNMNLKCATAIWQAKKFDIDKVDSMLRYMYNQTHEQRRILVGSLPSDCNGLERNALRHAAWRMTRPHISDNVDAVVASTLKASTRKIVKILKSYQHEATT